ncbi:nuclear transport factor 2 family protein [Streptomyces sp. NPDC051636]|uniref:nuclear transport factor 2 family protein n=1 Tax=Streptomyces sp. NPDC051636 TaxID=3365663 RepID=UPI0037AD5C8A
MAPTATPPIGGRAAHLSPPRPQAVEHHVRQPVHRLHGRVLATGKRFAYDVVMFARVRDGLITWSRVYSNPLAGAIAFDSAGEFLTALADT